MLCELKVENLALIESLHLNFDSDECSGLVVMTGETGAGKSIMLRAIQMLAGSRASADWIRSGADQCTVEALFEVSSEHSHFLTRLSEGGFGDDTTVIVKRVISAKGRSRLYVNGSLATVKIARELTANLLNVASQHDHQQLLQPQLHLDFLDTIGEHWQERIGFGHTFRKWQKCRTDLAELKKQEQDKEQKRDFLQYQLSEIEEAVLVEGEDEALEAEKKKLKNADRLIKLSQDCFGVFSSSVLDKLGRIQKKMEQIALLDDGAEQLAQEVSDYFYQAEDLVQQFRGYRDGLESDPFRLEHVTERIDQLQGLKRKYGGSIGAILDFGRSAEKELHRLENLEIQLNGLEQEVQKLGETLVAAAQVLSKKRKATSAQFEKSMSKELESLAFSNASVEVRWQEIDGLVEEIQPNGWDRAEFFFSANQGEPARALAKVASGGELSRLMLALKCLLARKDMVETVIFDEVDAGIGGEAAEAVSRKIQELASHHQVFCITHLPQIAARGDDHYLVKKSVNGGRTLSSITLLAEEEREHEVARMLAGESVSDQTNAWARELLTKR
jgi:DNA repair protein RecN (Recombination protein N)